MIASIAGEDDHGCDVGSEGDANVQRNIFELRYEHRQATRAAASQAFNGAAARGEAHLARIPDPFEAPRAKTIGSTTNIAIGEAHLALFVMWCPGGARSMFRTVSEIRAVKW